MRGGGELLTGVQVAVDNAAFQFDKLYSYNLPEELEPFRRIGARVLVPFGKNGSRMGIVLGLCDSDPSFKSVIEIEKNEPVITKEMVDLIIFLRETTFCTYYDAVKTILPKNIRLVPDEDGSELAWMNEGHTETVFEAVEEFDETLLTVKQRSLYYYLCEPHTFSEISRELGFSRDLVNRVLQKQAIRAGSRWKKTELDYSAPFYVNDFSLSDEQNKAAARISECMEDPSKPNTTLLYGVTSSGKTMLYLQLIREMTSKGKSTLLLVPEIALATQMIGRL